MAFRLSVVAGSAEPRDLYLELLKRVLSRDGFGFDAAAEIHARSWKRLVVWAVKRRGFRIIDPTQRAWLAGETMLSRRRLDNIQACVEAVLADDVPGDLIETGVWRGGAVILMRAVLAARGDTSRIVWAADSFAGFPQERRYELDRREDFTGGHGDDTLSVDLETVRANFARYGLLDDQVRFLVGLFADTLPEAPIERLAVLRLDGDLYQSTRDALTALYTKLSSGGFAIIDDYGTYAACRAAVDEYRAQERITDPILEIDPEAVYWRKA